MWRSNILNLVMVLVGCCHAMAQGVVFIASPGNAKMGIQDQIQVDFEISNVDNLTEMSPQGFGEFNRVAGPFQSTSISISNGQRSQSVKISYVLRPKHEGKFAIPGAIAKDRAGHSYTSNPISIEVVAGSLAPKQQPRRQPNGFDPFGDDEDPFAAMQQQMAQIRQLQQQMMQQMGSGRAMPPPSAPSQPPPPAQNSNDEDFADPDLYKKDLFIKVTVDKNKVHLGEQITASYKLYTTIPMQVNFSKLPSLPGFWTQDFDIPKQPKPTVEVVDGKRYQVFLLKKSALFPQQVGTLELDPAEAKGMAQVSQRPRQANGTLMMNDPFFNNAFFSGYRNIKVHLSSAPVKINVTPLPEKDKPTDFGGAVGNFSITSKLDKTDITTDDVATLTLTISGSGNLKLIDAPKLELPNGINTYDPQVVDTVTSRSTTIAGDKVITYAITPQTVGDYEIPATSFTFYNTETGRYTTLHTQPFKLHVKQGKNYNPAKAKEAALPVSLKDIHDIDLKPLGNVKRVSMPLFLSPLYWLAYVVPILLLFLAVELKRRRDELNRNTSLLRNKRANKMALARLEAAKRCLSKNESKGFYEEISKAIWLYLSDKTGIPLSALSKETAIETLQNKKVPAAMQQKFESIIWECETALYASGGNKTLSYTFDDAVKVISDLEGVL